MRHTCHILGHSNATIAMLIDTLLTCYPEEELEVCIVNNVPITPGPLYTFEGVARLKLTEIEAATWDGRAASRLIGVLKASTKRAVVASFRASHRLAERDYDRLVHPSAVVAHHAHLGPGVLLGPGVILAPYSSFGSLTTLNRGVIVGHHTTVGDYCTLNPGCNLAGNCRIGDDVTIGMGANVVDGITIGSGSVIGAGALVTRPIPPNVVAYGVPARVVSERQPAGMDLPARP